MSPPGKDVLERLGAGGLARALDDLLDSAKLVKLANACALSYPGMRAQSQRRERLLADVVERAGKNAAARKAILRALQRETAAAGRTWRGASDDERAALVAAALAGQGELPIGAALVLAASDPGGGASLDALLSRCDAPVVPEASSAAPEGRTRRPAVDGAGGRDDRELARLRKRQGELLKKIRHLEGQLTKSRDGEKQLKRDLIERKGELAESRMRVERLRREVDALRAGREGDDRKPPGEAAAAKSIESLSRTVRRLAAEQKKLAHAVGKAVEAAEREDGDDPVLRAVDDVRQALGELRKDRGQGARQLTEKLDDLASEVRAVRSAAAEPAATPSGRRRRGPDERVGVFVDVQNVYYGARQLKGKLDFDALLQAATAGRRLVLARAYVVESKEIDQSGFIAMLQQRAIQVRRKTLRVRADGSMKGDWDMEMALDILDATAGLDVVVLVSGDGDFTSLVTRVKAIGPRVEVVAFPRTTAKSLIEAADRFQALDRKFMIRTEQPAAAASGDRAPEEAEGETIATGGGRAG